MTQELVAYRWVCPICSETKRGLSTMPTVTVGDQAKNALISHLRTKGGGGHGRPEEYPFDYDSEALLEFIEIGRDIEDDTRAIPG